MPTQSYIKLYKNTPTAGAQDGTEVSQDGTQTSPISVNLDASQNASQKVKLAIRTATGYKTTGSTVLTPVGSTADKWSLSLTENGSYGSSLAIGSDITDVNTIFYAQIASSSLEAPQNDISVSIGASCSIAAV